MWHVLEAGMHSEFRAVNHQISGALIAVACRSFRITSTNGLLIATRGVLKATGGHGILPKMSLVATITPLGAKTHGIINVADSALPQAGLRMQSARWQDTS